MRELRTPLIAGLLWLGTFVISGLLDLREVTTNLLRDTGLTNLSIAVTTPAILGFAFLLGTLAKSLIAPAFVFTGTKIRHAVYWIQDHSHHVNGDNNKRTQKRPKWIYKLIGKLELRHWPLSQVDRNVMMDSINAHLTAVGSTGSAAFFFPYNSAIDTLPQCAAQLAQTAPIQYQEYDRLRSEVELRLAIAPPLVFLGFVLPYGHRLVDIILCVVTASVLLIQAVERERASTKIVVTAVYLNYIDIPIVKSITDGLKTLSRTPQSDDEWTAAILTTVHNHGYFEEADVELHQAFYMQNEEEIDPEDDVIGPFLKEFCPSLHVVWEGLMEKHQSDT